MIKNLNSITVFAPATTANVVVGFDILGFAMEALGDEITLVKSSNKSLRIESITGSEHIPYDLNKNTVTVALLSMLDYLNLKQGFYVHIKKRIPISSGLGGSAAGSVAALVALNHFLESPLPREQLVEFALTAEQTACGVKHGDNVIPCLYGGMTLIQSLSPAQVINLPLIPLYVVLLHPHMHLSTREARAVLDQSMDLSLHVKQNARIAAFVSALYEKDYQRLEASCVDDLIEPLRAHLIPGFFEVKSVAYQFGALACSISGSGPTMFALVKTMLQAQHVAKRMAMEFKKIGMECDSFITKISLEGAKIVDEN